MKLASDQMYPREGGVEETPGKGLKGYGHQRAG